MKFLRPRALASLAPAAWLAFWFLFALGVAASLRGAEAVPAGSVDTGAVLRAGDRVEHVAGGVWEASPEAVISQAIEATPADDRDKWYVSLVTLPTCPPCKALVADWSGRPGVSEEALPMGVRKLRAIARPDPAEKADSWAHFQRYNAGDASQKAHFAKLKLGGFPAVVVQPPLSGKYGPNVDAVFVRSGYDGDAEKLAEDIMAAIRARVAKYAPEEFKRQQEAEKRALVEGYNNLPPQPFDPFGAESVFPIFPKDEADEGPPQGYLDQFKQGAGEWFASSLFRGLDSYLGGWAGELLGGLGALLGFPLVGKLASFLWWFLPWWYGLGKKKPGEGEEAEPSSPSWWDRLTAALAALKGPEAAPATPARRSPRKAPAAKRKR